VIVTEHEVSHAEISAILQSLSTAYKNLTSLSIIGLSDQKLQRFVFTGSRNQIDFLCHETGNRVQDDHVAMIASALESPHSRFSSICLQSKKWSTVRARNGKTYAK
jgi:hypothetical protein